MSNNRKLKAFTLLELTIAMLIGAVCMGIAFYVLTTFNRIAMLQETQKKETYLRQLFAQRLQKETLDAQRIWLVDNTIILENDEWQTRYMLSDSSLVRWQGELPTDTMKGKVGLIEVNYVPNISAELVEKWAFELRTEQGIYPFVLQKEYSAEELLHLSSKTLQ